MGCHDSTVTGVRGNTAISGWPLDPVANYLISHVYASNCVRNFDFGFISYAGIRSRNLVLSSQHDLASTTWLRPQDVYRHMATKRAERDCYWCRWPQQCLRILRILLRSRLQNLGQAVRQSNLASNIFIHRLPTSPLEQPTLLYVNRRPRHLELSRIYIYIYQQSSGCLLGPCRRTITVCPVMIMSHAYFWNQAGQGSSRDAPQPYWQWQRISCRWDGRVLQQRSDLSRRPTQHAN